MSSNLLKIRDDGAGLVGGGDQIQECMKSFRTYLDRTGMDHKPYQFQGVEWCLRRELFLDSGRRGGGIIADEMGLGKTIMTIGLCLCHPMKKTLIVVPVILMDQWVSQIQKTTGYRPLVYHGHHIRSITPEMLKNAFVVITTYHSLVYHQKKYLNPYDKSSSDFVIVQKKNPLLHRISWNRIVFDEAHHLRNPKTTLVMDCLELALKTKICWLITGTPIQNYRKDFYHLCLFLGLDKNFVRDNTETVVKTYVMKRTKAEVGILLPDVKRSLEHVSWKNRGEMELSHVLHSQLNFCYLDGYPLPLVMEEGSGSGVGTPEGLKYSGEISRFMALFRSYPSLNRGDIRRRDDDKALKLRLLNASKQFCIYPKMLENVVVAAAAEEAEPSSSSSSFLQSNSKLDSVVNLLLERKGNQNGKLVFCNYHKEMNTLCDSLVKDGGYDKDRVLIYRRGGVGGGVGGDVFYEVLIIQIQTGCEGLNLQQYNEVYFVSPHWNPMVEEQAIARCHRIGQKKDVFVFHFIMDGFYTSEAEDNHELMDEQKILSRSLDKYILDVHSVKKKEVQFVFEGEG